MTHIPLPLCSVPGRSAAGSSPCSPCAGSSFCSSARTALTALVALALLSACQSDWRNGITPDRQPQPITFAATVTPSVTDTRADGSLVNRLEVRLPASQEREYYVYDPTTQTVVKKSRQYYVGLCAAYTDGSTWQRTQYHTPGLIFNQKAAIEAYSGGRNALTYSPLRYWPVESSAETQEYTSFWAYYPWNDTGDPGTYGIAITDDAGKTYSQSLGMGRVRFTMHADAAEQVDFMATDIVADRTRQTNPLQQEGDDGTYVPTPVTLNFRHMLAQVRLYAFIRGTDKMVYQQNAGKDQVADETWFDSWSVGDIITDAYGNVYTKAYKNGEDDTEGYIVKQTTTGKADLTKAEFLALGLKVPDETKTVRWDREDGVWDVTHSRRRANITYSMSLNNIYTACDFTPTYDGAKTTVKADVVGAATHSATVNHYIMNPYWFRFDAAGQRVMLNDTYMYDYFEDTPAYKASSMTDTEAAAAEEQDGINWRTYRYGKSNAMGYDIETSTGYELLDRSGNEATKDNHYNYAPGNILLVVPQKLTDDDVPHIIITATGYRTVWKKDGAVVAQDTDGAQEETETLTARVTINMLNMNLKWESGFIYCYAFVDELQPGDDKVRGPETITVVFDPTKHTDQW